MFLQNVKILTMLSLLLLRHSVGAETCSICLDGSDTMTNTNTCADIQELANNQMMGTKDCDSLQLSAYQVGCCESYPMSGPCTLCPNGKKLPESNYNIEIPQRHIQQSNDENLLQCADLIPDNNNDIEDNSNVHLGFLSFVGSPGICSDTKLRRSAAWCGCPGTEPQCSICGKDGILQSDKTHPLTGETCRQLAYDISLLQSEECDRASISFGFDVAALCCAGGSLTQPNNSNDDDCSICPKSNQQLVGERTVVTESYGEIKCSVAEEAAMLVSSKDQCARFLRGQDLSSSCCVTTDIECELTCPSTGLPPSIDKIDPVTGYACKGNLASYFETLTKEECPNASTLLGFDAVSFCCEDIPAPKTCSVCEDAVNQVLLYPGQVLLSYGELSCADIQQSASYMVGEDACNKLIDESRANRNCQCRQRREGDDEIDGQQPDAVGTSNLLGESDSSHLSLQTCISIVSVLFLGVTIAWL